MIDNDPSKSIGSITKEMGVSEFLNSRILHKDISYASHQINKG